MSKPREMTKHDELRSEYKREDLGEGERGKYHKAFQAGHNLVLFKPEVAQAFPSEKVVNDALLALIEVAQKAVNRSKDPS
ncbi:hypothetical protein ACFL27_17850 [candidate division CSSED10-310 bacterium]|uniref:Uncharacterized protein n=1 Tax=candidate division CSSED10-310 bacterium TaxID=2855610 RepID=A0ABV6Z149_UNCC1